MKLDYDSITKFAREKPTLGTAILLSLVGAIVCFIGLAIMVRPFVVGNQHPLGIIVMVIIGLSLCAIAKELILKRVPLILKGLAYFTSLMMMVVLAIVSGY